MELSILIIVYNLITYALLKNTTANECPVSKNAMPLWWLARKMLCNWDLFSYIFQKGQLCRPVFEGTNNAEAMSHTIPAEVADVGPEKGNKAVWIGASGDRSFIKVDEALISPDMLESATIFASKSAIGEQFVINL